MASSSRRCSGVAFCATDGASWRIGTFVAGVASAGGDDAGGGAETGCADTWATRGGGDGEALVASAPAAARWLYAASRSDVSLSAFIGRAANSSDAAGFVVIALVVAPACRSGAGVAGNAVAADAFVGAGGATSVGTAAVGWPRICQARPATSTRLAALPSASNQGGNR